MELYFVANSQIRTSIKAMFDLGSDLVDSPILNRFNGRPELAVASIQHQFKKPAFIHAGFLFSKTGFLKYF
jgi:hypothetical protein